MTSRDSLNEDRRVERLDEVKRARQALASGDPAALKVSVEELIEKTASFQEHWIGAEERWREGVTPWTKEINRLRDVLRADESDAGRMREALTLHYGVRVAPVNEYCDAFLDWARALQELLDSPECRNYDRQQYERVLSAVRTLYPLPILKSNYLARRIYGGEPHRTEKCPVHKGRWSGCHAPDSPDGSCECVSGGNTTGWLPSD